MAHPADPGLVAYSIGFPGVACPAVSACYALASYPNNGPSLTLGAQNAQIRALR